MKTVYGVQSTYMIVKIDSVGESVSKMTKKHPPCLPTTLHLYSLVAERVQSYEEPNWTKAEQKLQEPSLLKNNSLPTGYM